MSAGLACCLVQPEIMCMRRVCACTRLPAWLQPLALDAARSEHASLLTTYVQHNHSGRSNSAAHYMHAGAAAGRRLLGPGAPMRLGMQRRQALLALSLGCVWPCQVCPNRRVCGLQVFRSLSTLAASGVIALIMLPLSQIQVCWQQRPAFTEASVDWGSRFTAVPGSFQRSVGTR